MSVHLDPDSPTFLVTPCACSTHLRLAARELDAHDALVWCCASCGQLVNPDAPLARWVSAHELDELGFFVEGLEPEPKHDQGGCRGGRCGVQQGELG